MSVVVTNGGTFSLRRAVDAVLAPMVARDGGELRWVRRDGDVVEVSLGGAYVGGPGQRDVIDGVVLPALRAIDPSVASVRVVAPARG